MIYRIARVVAALPYCAGVLVDAFLHDPLPKYVEIGGIWGEAA